MRRAPVGFEFWVIRASARSERAPRRRARDVAAERVASRQTACPSVASAIANDTDTRRGRARLSTASTADGVSFIENVTAVVFRARRRETRAGRRRKSTHLHDAGDEAGGTASEGALRGQLHDLPEGHLLLLLGLLALARELADGGHGREREIAPGEARAERGERGPGARLDGEPTAGGLELGSGHGRRRWTCVRARKVWGQVAVDPLDAKRWLPRARRRKLPSSKPYHIFRILRLRPSTEPCSETKRRGARTTFTDSSSPKCFGSSWHVECESAAGFDNLLPRSAVRFRESVSALDIRWWRATRGHGRAAGPASRPEPGRRPSRWASAAWA